MRITIRKGIGETSGSEFWIVTVELGSTKYIFLRILDGEAKGDYLLTE